MAVERATAWTTVRPAPPPTAPLRDRGLALARAAWLVVAALAVGGFVASLPARWGLLSSLAATARVEGTQLDLLPSVYYGYVLAEQVALALAFGALGALIAWRTSHRPGRRSTTP